AEDDDDAGSGPLAMAAGPPVTPRPQGATARTGGAPPVTPRQRPSDIVRQVKKALAGLPIRERHFRHQAFGIYKPDVQEIRVRVANDLPTIFHEAGHHLDIAVLGIKRSDKRWKYELHALGQATSRPSYTSSKVRAEGAAEFFRLYVMDPAKAAAEAPKYFAEFEARLDAHPDLRDALLETRQNYQDYASQDPVERLLMRIDTTGRSAAAGARQLVTDPRGWFRQQAIGWMDDLKPIKDAVDAMVDGRSLGYRHNAYVLARLARGAAGRAQGFLEHGVRGRNGRFLSGSLADALKPVAADLELFSGYLVALRTVELRGRGIETGVSLDEAKATIARVAARDDAETFDAARDAVYAYQDATLEYARQYGALSKQQIAQMKALNRNYVPFKRVMDDVAGSWSGVSRKIANRNLPIRRIKGSGRDIINPLESIVVNTHVLVDMVDKNRAMLALTNLAGASQGSARYLTKIPAPQIPTHVNVLEVLGGAVGEKDPAIADLVKATGLTESDVVTLFSPAFMGKPGEQIVTVIRKGTREFYQVNDPDLYEAITRVGPNLKDSVMAAMFEPFTRLLRAGATLTPEFIVRNPGRDTLVAYLQSRYGFIPGVDTVRGLIGLILNDDDAKLYFSSGIDQAALVGQDRQRVRQDLAKLTTEGHAQLAKYFVRNPLELLRALSSQMENATRLGEFKLALEAGGVERGILKRLFGPSNRVVNEETLTRATLAARDVTTDFSRGGQKARELNRYSAFFNARVQGYVRLGETVARDPIGTLEHVASLAAFSALLWFWNNDDEEYDELPEWERRTYWHIKMPGANYFIRVPKPFEWGYVPDLVEGALEWTKTRDASAWRVVKPSDAAMT
ncbi:MAG: LPD38 domain-containing protein, partial [Vicinamibacterales bacterium]